MPKLRKSDDENRLCVMCKNSKMLTFKNGDTKHYCAVDGTELSPVLCILATCDDFQSLFKERADLVDAWCDAIEAVAKLGEDDDEED